MLPNFGRLLRREEFFLSRNSSKTEEERSGEGKKVVEIS